MTDYWHCSIGFGFTTNALVNYICVQLGTQCTFDGQVETDEVEEEVEPRHVCALVEM